MQVNKKLDYVSPTAIFLAPAPYALLLKQVEALKSLSKEEMLSILAVSVQATLQSIQFDEEWYLSAYPDVQKAVTQGEFTSGLDHYKAIGFFESRIPQKIDFDEDFYCATYPDIKRAQEMGTLSSPKLHFLTRGFAEGRIPSKDYSFAKPSAIDLARQIRRRIAV